MNNEQFKCNPRAYARALCEDGLISWETLAIVLLQSMSHDDVIWALDANELSPRFINEDDKWYEELEQNLDLPEQRR